MARFLDRDWWTTSEGTMFGQERAFDPLSGVLTIVSHSAGRKRKPVREHRIRLYNATQLAELCAASGLIVEEAYDGWRDRPIGRASSEMLLVARKRARARELPRRARRR
jgi:hypothetical protein